MGKECLFPGNVIGNRFVEEFLAGFWEFANQAIAQIVEFARGAAEVCDLVGNYKSSQIFTSHEVRLDEFY